MQETRKIFWQDLVRSEDRCYLALAVFFIRRNDFSVSGSVQQFLQLQLLSKFYCSECFNPIDNDLLASLIWIQDLFRLFLFGVFCWFVGSPPPECTVWDDTSCCLRTAGCGFPSTEWRELGRRDERKYGSNSLAPWPYFHRQGLAASWEASELLCVPGYPARILLFFF